MALGNEWDVLEWQRQYDAQQRRACDAEAEVERLRAENADLRQQLANARAELRNGHKTLTAAGIPEADDSGALSVTGRVMRLRQQLAAAQARQQEFRDRLGPEWSEWLGEAGYFCDWCDAAQNDNHSKDCPWFILGQPDHAALDAALAAARGLRDAWKAKAKYYKARGIQEGLRIVQAQCDLDVGSIGEFLEMTARLAFELYQANVLDTDQFHGFVIPLRCAASSVDAAMRKAGRKPMEYEEYFANAPLLEDIKAAARREGREEAARWCQHEGERLRTSAQRPWDSGLLLNEAADRILRAGELDRAADAIRALALDNPPEPEDA